MVLTSPSHSKILQWLHVDSSINITHIGALSIVSIFIIHALIVSGL